MPELSEQEIANIKALIDNIVAGRKKDILIGFAPDKLETKINAVAASDKNKNNKIDTKEAPALIQSFLAANPDGNKILHSMCEQAATDDQIGKNAQQALAGNAEKIVSGIKFIKEIAEAIKKGEKTPESAIESYRFMELSVPNHEIRTYVDKANKEVALAMSEQIGRVLRHDTVLTDKAASFPDASGISSLDANQVCVGVNNRGIGRSL